MILLGMLHAKETGISSCCLVFGWCAPLPFYFLLLLAALSYVAWCSLTVFYRSIWSIHCSFSSEHKHIMVELKGQFSGESSSLSKLTLCLFLHVPSLVSFRNYLEKATTPGPVTFCHNDLQEGLSLYLFHNIFVADKRSPQS